MSGIFNEFLFLFQRLNWLSVVDLILVTIIFFAILMAVKDTQAMTLMRGVILLVIVLSLLTSLFNLPAFSWLIRTSLPALLLAIPVIFAPELRRAMERLGRAGPTTLFFSKENRNQQLVEKSIRAIVTAATRLSARKHGALIIMKRVDDLREYIRTGVRLDAGLTPELLLQIFYPNTPLHDGAVIISDEKVTAAACVMPLSSSGILNRTPDRQMGLRHRAALGISEASDAVALVVSEETGAISIAHNGRMIRRLDSERLENILNAFYNPDGTNKSPGLFSQLREILKPRGKWEE